jgi:osmotically inducible protein OsmC
VTWNGDLISGAGTIDEVGSGAFGPLDVSWAARSEEASGGKTSPEELIAAAHASCFSMALAHALAGAGNAPDRLETSATVTFVPGTGITKSALTVRGSVPGLDADGFREAAEEAKKNCPVSQALAGVPEITLDAELA